MYKLLGVRLERPESQFDLFDENRVVSKLRINFSVGSRFKTYVLQVVEHRDFLVPFGVWKIKKEYSPKFKRDLLEFKDLPYQKEVKFHVGTDYKKLGGCIGMSKSNLEIFLHTMEKCGINEHYITVKEI